VSFDRLAAVRPAHRIGLGLAAVGRPGYINLGHNRDLPADRSVETLRAHTHRLLDEAYALGVRYVDAARSYGLAEDFLAGWLSARPGAGDVVVGSKWGYTYTAGWRVDADVHETKDHGVATFERQYAETTALLGDRLDLYQIHSVTPDSPALTDPDLHRRLARLARQGVTVGISVSGVHQADAIRAALAVQAPGPAAGHVGFSRRPEVQAPGVAEPLFRSVQATWNLLEPSAGAALAEAHAAGCAVIVKEALANGRLTGRDPGLSGGADLARVAAEAGATADAVALAAALHQPWVDVVLSGASTAGQLTSNLRAAAVRLDPDQLRRLGGLAEPADGYWRHRARLAWA
jgi:aryl-alcohol dehydrogenase-like predicted oxidoreductase